ncbi:MAG: hypothetical protein IKR18_12110 [Bacteroidaceae bacterium]|nr:hypothetical protein [Bacteroidaceae bacterium]
MKKSIYLKPDIDILELELEGIIAESDSQNFGGEYDGGGGNVKGLTFDPVTGVSLELPNPLNPVNPLE